MLWNSPLRFPTESIETVPTTRRIRTLVVDDHKMFADALANQLGAWHDVEVVGRAFSASTGIEAAERSQPDVAIIDYCLRDGDGISVATRLRATCPATKVLLLTGSRDDWLVPAAFSAGCSGFLTKDADMIELVHAVRQLGRGGSYVPPHLAPLLLPHLDGGRRDIGTDLSSREREVLELLATGAATRSIADSLFVSVTTVRNHVQRILLKLRAHSKLEAVVIAVREGIIATPR